MSRLQAFAERVTQEMEKAADGYPLGSENMARTRVVLERELRGFVLTVCRYAADAKEAELWMDT